jgi:hypothetical protein
MSCSSRERVRVEVDDLARGLGRSVMVIVGR